jgi:hypothetical protein
LLGINKNALATGETQYRYYLHFTKTQKTLYGYNIVTINSLLMQMCYIPWKNNCILLIHFAYLTAYLGNFLVHIACIYWTFFSAYFPGSITYGFVPMSFYLQLLLHNFQRRTALQCSPIWLLHTKENQPGNHGMRKQ